ncbi:CLUMA_CG013857, isoform A [Clunio marinus]|uniref:CLUMA_CG013857, isoform A n=1 Tax=Clunio marinus TaxID=568069 RepID=A0A1J1IK25_9DIPT|nr:CLUMA_CG013857, isoform A [Clunio marinus]
MYERKDIQESEATRRDSLPSLVQSQSSNQQSQSSTAYATLENLLKLKQRSPLHNWLDEHNLLHCSVVEAIFSLDKKNTTKERFGALEEFQDHQNEAYCQDMFEIFAISLLDYESTKAIKH